MADHRMVIRRTDEQSVVDALLGSLRDGMSQALVIRGEPGIGKTTLLGHLIESASDAQSETVTLSDGGEVTAHWSESVGKAVLVSDGLPSIADDESFELWFVRDGAAIPAGTFTSEDGTATALLEGAIESGDVIAVTVEQAGGSPTGQPTSDPIIAIETA